MANIDVSTLHSGVDTIVKKAVSNLSFNKTVSAVIVDDSGKDTGRYVVDEGTASYSAYSLDEYQIGDTVQILIPNGDYNEQKSILRKEVRDDDKAYYQDPKDNICIVSKNIINNEILNNDEQTKEILLLSKQWNKSSEDFSSNSHIQNINYFIGMSTSSLIDPEDIPSGNLFIYLEKRDQSNINWTTEDSWTYSITSENPLQIFNINQNISFDNTGKNQTQDEVRLTFSFQPSSNELQTINIFIYPIENIGVLQRDYNKKRINRLYFAFDLAANNEFIYGNYNIKINLNNGEYEFIFPSSEMSGNVYKTNGLTIRQAACWAIDLEKKITQAANNSSKIFKLENVNISTELSGDVFVDINGTAVSNPTLNIGLSNLEMYLGIDPNSMSETETEIYFIDDKDEEILLSGFSNNMKEPKQNISAEVFYKDIENNKLYRSNAAMPTGIEEGLGKKVALRWYRNSPTGVAAEDDPSSEDGWILVQDGLNKAFVGNQFEYTLNFDEEVLKLDQLKIRAMLYIDGEPIHVFSNILSLTNESIEEGATPEVAANLRIEASDSRNGIYFIYGQNNNIVSDFNSYQSRYLIPYYSDQHLLDYLADTLKVGQEVEIRWLFNNSYEYCSGKSDQNLDIYIAEKNDEWIETNNDFNVFRKDINSGCQINSNNEIIHDQYIIVKKVKSKTKTDSYQEMFEIIKGKNYFEKVDSGWKLHKIYLTNTDDTENELTESKTNDSLKQKFQFDYSLATTKPIVKQTKISLACFFEKTQSEDAHVISADFIMKFGRAGTNGTNYVFEISPEDGRPAVLTTEANDVLTIIPYLYDKDGNDISDRLGPITYTWERPQALEYKILKYEIPQGSKNALISIDTNYRENDHCYHILKASTSYNGIGLANYLAIGLTNMSVADSKVYTLDGTIDFEYDSASNLGKEFDKVVPYKINKTTISNAELKKRSYKIFYDPEKYRNKWENDGNLMLFYVQGTGNNVEKMIENSEWSRNHDPSEPNPFVSNAITAITLKNWDSVELGKYGYFVYNNNLSVLENLDNLFNNYFMALPPDYVWQPLSTFRNNWKQVKTWYNSYNDISITEEERNKCYVNILSYLKDITKLALYGTAGIDDGDLFSYFFTNANFIKNHYQTVPGHSINPPGSPGDLTPRCIVGETIVDFSNIKYLYKTPDLDLTERISKEDDVVNFAFRRKYYIENTNSFNIENYEIQDFELKEDNNEYIMSPPKLLLLDPNDMMVKFQFNNNKWLHQPIICIKNTWASTLVNEWDGKVIVDENNNAVMSAMMVAGKKNSNNQFSGVMLGSIQGDHQSSLNNIGIYGFDNGEQSYAFKTDGTAFIGKASTGRINFDGNNGIIESAHFSEASSTSGIAEEDRITGLQIDLKNGILKARNATLNNAKVYGAITATSLTLSGNSRIDLENAGFATITNVNNYISSQGYLTTVEWEDLNSDLKNTIQATALANNSIIELNSSNQNLLYNTDSFKNKNGLVVYRGYDPEHPNQDYTDSQINDFEIGTTIIGGKDQSYFILANTNTCREDGSAVNSSTEKYGTTSRVYLEHSGSANYTFSFDYCIQTQAQIGGIGLLWLATSNDVYALNNAFTSSSVQKLFRTVSKNDAEYIEAELDADKMKTLKQNKLIRDGQWHRASWTFTTGANDKSGYIRIDHNGNSVDNLNTYFRITNLQLEKGSKATPYKPNNFGIGNAYQTGITVSNIKYNSGVPYRDVTIDWSGSTRSFQVPNNGAIFVDNAVVKGTIISTNGVFSGRLESTEGNIGGWEIGRNYLGQFKTATTERMLLVPNGTNDLFDIAGKNQNGWTIIAGDKFGVDKYGSLYASSAHITGEITATGGTIGGWEIKSAHLQYGTIGQNNSMLLKPGGTTSNYRIGGIYKKGWTIASGSNFGVDDNGALYATAAHITGEITATSGKIGQLNLVNGYLQQTNYYKFTSTTAEASSFNYGVNFSIGFGESFEINVDDESAEATEKCKNYFNQRGIRCSYTIGDDAPTEAFSLTPLEGLYVNSKIKTDSYFIGKIHFESRLISSNDAQIYVDNNKTLCFRGPTIGLGTRVSITMTESRSSSQNGKGNLEGAWYLRDSAISTSSDQNLKNTINPISNQYSNIFDSLKPVTFKYNNGTSNRLHTGFIAQDVEQAIYSAGLTTQDFAGLVIDHENEQEQYYLRYEEFIALNTYEIQKLKAENADLKTQIDELQEAVRAIQQQLQS